MSPPGADPLTLSSRDSLRFGTWPGSANRPWHCQLRRSPWGWVRVKLCFVTQMLISGGASDHFLTVRARVRCFVVSGGHGKVLCVRQF